MRPHKSLDDKTILVIGAAGLIGRSIINAILNSGAKVVALDMSVKGLNELKLYYGNRVSSYSIVDITDKKSLEDALVNAHIKLGSICGAVNASYPRGAHYGVDFLDVNYDDFCENVTLHLGGFFLFMQLCAKYSLKYNLPFSLVNISSIYGSIAPRFDVYEETSMTMPVEYAAIKSGIEHLSRYINSYMKGHHTLFRSNCLSPGGILSNQDKNFIKRYNKYCLSKGMLDAQDIADPVIFLLSDASRYVVGQNLIVDDGFSA